MCLQRLAHKMPVPRAVFEAENDLATGWSIAREGENDCKPPTASWVEIRSMTVASGLQPGSRATSSWLCR